MGLKCVIFDHDDDVIKQWGEEAEYVLFKCKRCEREEIYCSYESVWFANDNFGRAVLKRMLNDKAFSFECHKYFTIKMLNGIYGSKREGNLKKMRELMSEWNLTEIPEEDPVAEFKDKLKGLGLKADGPESGIYFMSEENLDSALKRSVEDEDYEVAHEIAELKKKVQIEKDKKKK